MINYHIRKNKKTRITLRIIGLAIMVICGSQIAAFIMGYGRTHRIGTIFACLFCLYGLYLLVSSFKSRAYDMDFEFKENEFSVKMRYGTKTYSYDEILTFNQISPDNALFYTIIQIYVGKKQYVLPFSYKKDAADAIFALLSKKTGLYELNEEDTAEDVTVEKTEESIEDSIEENEDESKEE